MFDLESKRLKIDSNQKVIVALTNATLDPALQKEFDFHTLEIYRNLDSYPGYIAGTIRRQIFGSQVWTVTVWTTLESLENFRKSDRHLTA